MANNSTLQYVKQNGSAYADNIIINDVTSSFIDSLTYKDYPIPTIESVLDLTARVGANVTLEIKDSIDATNAQSLLSLALQKIGD